MKLILIVFSTIFYFSCTSTVTTKKPLPDFILDRSTGKRYKRNPDFIKKGKKMIEVEKRKKDGKVVDKKVHWVEPGYRVTSLTHLPLKQITTKERIKSYDGELLLELSSRGKRAVPYLIHYLTSKKDAVLPDNMQNFKWYENKESFEPIAQSIYAAYLLQNLTQAKPLGIVIKLERKHSILYAIKDKYAVKKEKVTEAWQQWWKGAKNRYKK